jgi:hypothetical protein
LFPINAFIKVSTISHADRTINRPMIALVNLDLASVTAVGFPPAVTSPNPATTASTANSTMMTPMSQSMRVLPITARWQAEQVAPSQIPAKIPWAEVVSGRRARVMRAILKRNFI